MSASVSPSYATSSLTTPPYSCRQPVFPWRCPRCRALARCQCISIHPLPFHGHPTDILSYRIPPYVTSFHTTSLHRRLLRHTDACCAVRYVAAERKWKKHNARGLTYRPIVLRIVISHYLHYFCIYSFPVLFSWKCCTRGGPGQICREAGIGLRVRE